MFTQEELRRIYVQLSVLNGDDPEAENKTDKEIVDRINQLTLEWYEENITPMPTELQVVSLFNVALKRLDPNDIYLIDNRGSRVRGYVLLNKLDDFIDGDEWKLSKKFSDYHLLYKQLYVALTSTI